VAERRIKCVGESEPSDVPWSQGLHGTSIHSAKFTHQSRDRQTVKQRHTLLTISTLSLTVTAFSDQQSTGLASYDTPTIRCWSECVEQSSICTYDETLATDYLSEKWKQFCPGVNWPWRIVTVACFVCTLEISLLTYRQWDMPHFVKINRMHSVDPRQYYSGSLSSMKHTWDKVTHADRTSHEPM